MHILKTLILATTLLSTLSAKPIANNCEVVSIQTEGFLFILTESQKRQAKEETFIIDHKKSIIGYDNIYHTYTQTIKDKNSTYDLYLIGKTKQHDRYTIRIYHEDPNLIYEYMSQSDIIIYKCTQKENK